MSIRSSLIRAAILAAASAAAPAAEIDYVLRAGVTHSDNIERLPAGEERGTRAATAGLALSGGKETGRLRYSALADLSYHDYLNLDLDSELLGRAAVGGAYHFLPERISWNADLTYDQVREDILRPIAAGNRESEVRFSTGPTLRTQLGGAMEGQLDARYTRLDYSDRPFDNETLGARALLGRRASPRSLLALGYSFDDVSYVSSAAPPGLDFERQEVFARLELAGVRTRLDVEAGYAEVSGVLVDDGGAVLRLQLDRRMTPMLSGFLGYVREYPTSEQTMAVPEPLPGTGGGDASLLTSAPRLATRVETGLRLERPRTRAELAYALRREGSLLPGEGRRRYDEVRASVTRDFTPRSQGALYAAVVREDLSLLSGNADELLAGARFGFTFGRALGVDLRVEYRDRNGAAPTSDYSELSGGLFLRYAGTLGR